MLKQLGTLATSRRWSGDTNLYGDDPVEGVLLKFIIYNVTGDYGKVRETLLFRLAINVDLLCS
jgi:hypothetical protein